MGTADEALEQSTTPNEVVRRCSFCGKSEHDVRKLIAAPTIHICDECVAICNDIIASNAAPDATPDTAPTFLRALVDDFARGLVAADTRRLRAFKKGTAAPRLPGIGPGSLAHAIDLIVAEMRAWAPERYSRVETRVPYPIDPNQRSDLVLHLTDASWFVRVETVELLNADGRLDNRKLLRFLSPYPHHQSTVTICQRLAESGLPGHKAILLFGYESEAWPLEIALQALEAVVGRLSLRASAYFDVRGHPVYRTGSVHAWVIV